MSSKIIFGDCVKNAYKAIKGKKSRYATFSLENGGILFDDKNLMVEESGGPDSLLTDFFRSIYKVILVI